ncbi:MAG TPA: RodZ domain-containing protein [Candidatus Obscuribacterales bacterium]
MAVEHIGQKLKAAREGQGLSLRQIYERTKIPIGHLHSIDNGQWDELPEPVYVAGFIKRYAECVGLNGQALSEEYRKQAEEKQPNGQNHWPAAQPTYVAAEYTRGKVDREPPTFKTIYFNTIWIVVVVGLISYLTMTQLNNQANQQDPSVLSLRETTARYAGTPASGTSANAPPGGAAASTNDARVSLSASQHVWVEVKAVSSGESLFTGYLEQGDRRDFQDAQGLRIRAGNGGSLTVDFQGKIETFGETGKVAERTFMAKSAVASEGPAAGAAEPAAVKPAAVRRPVTKRSNESALSQARTTRYRTIEDAPTRQYIPGESLGGGTRSIDVPYRYTEGRLDAD